MKFESAIRIIWSSKSGKMKWDRYCGFGVIEKSAKSGIWCDEAGNELFLAIEEVEVSDRFESSKVSDGPFSIKEKLWNVSELNGRATIRNKRVASVISEKCVGEVEMRNGDLKKLIGEVETRNGDLKFGGIDRPSTGDLKLVVNVEVEALIKGGSNDLKKSVGCIGKSDDLWCIGKSDDPKKVGCIGKSDDLWFIGKSDDPKKVGCSGKSDDLWCISKSNYPKNKFAVIDSGIESKENGKCLSTSESSDISSEEGVGMCNSGTRESGEMGLSHELSHEDCARI